MPFLQSAKVALDFGIHDRSSARRAQYRGIAVIIGALLTAGVSFAVLIGLIVAGAVGYVMATQQG